MKLVGLVQDVVTLFKKRKTLIKTISTIQSQVGGESSVNTTVNYTNDEKFMQEHCTEVIAAAASKPAMLPIGSSLEAKIHAALCSYPN